MDLHTAAFRGSTSDIECALDDGCDVNARNQDGNTPLELAAKAGGNPDACRLLIDRGAVVKGDEILQSPIRGNHIELVELLWPHGQWKDTYDFLETAVSLGYHEIADFFVQTGAFKYENLQASEILKEAGFSTYSDDVNFDQWERFIFARRSESLDLHPMFFCHALILACKPHRNAGLRLVNALLEGETPLATADCEINIQSVVETPLVTAALNGNLEILDTLVRHIERKGPLSEKYRWAALLNMLAKPGCLASEKGRAIAHTLSKGAIPTSFTTEVSGASLVSVFENVLRHGDDVLLNRVIELLHDTAGPSILPLLVRGNVSHDLERYLKSEALRELKANPDLWMLVCDFFHRHPDSEGVQLLIRVAESMIQMSIWDPMILTCIRSSNFSFAKHLFYPLNELPPQEVTEVTLAELSKISKDQSFMKEWADKGFANATLWSAIQFGAWKNEEFASFLSYPHLDLNEAFPAKQRIATKMAPEIPPPLKNPFPQHWQSQSMPQHTENSENPENLGKIAKEDYQMQLMLIEQQNKRRLMLAREEHERITGRAIDFQTHQQPRMPTNQAYEMLAQQEQTRKMMIAEKQFRGVPIEKHILHDTRGKVPLAWATVNRKRQLVDLLLRTSRVNVNAQDIWNTTPLIQAAVMNDQKSVEKFLTLRDIDLNVQDVLGRTAIFNATIKGNIQIIKLLGESGKVDFSIVDSGNHTVNELAAMTGKPDVMATLSAYVP